MNRLGETRNLLRETLAELHECALQWLAPESEHPSRFHPSTRSRSAEFEWLDRGPIVLGLLLPDGTETTDHAHVSTVARFVYIIRIEKGSRAVQGQR